MLQEARKILVIKLRAIGDVVLATPVIENLRKAYPQARIDFLVDDEAVDVVKGNPFLDEAIVTGRGRLQRLPKFRALQEQWEFLRKLRGRKYDLVFDLFGNPRSAFLTLATRAPHRVGFRFRGRQYAYNHRVEPRGDRVHEVEFNLDALRALGVPIVSRRLYFPIEHKDDQFVQEWIGRNHLQHRLRVAFYVGGSWPAKRWYPERFAELADALVEHYGAVPIFVWGPGEFDYTQAVVHHMQHPGLLAPPTSLKRLAALLSHCHLMIANDSGPMHISAAVGTPTLGIYGPTNPRLQGPYGDIHRVVFKRGLDCLGCNRLKCDHMTCMKELTVPDVLEVVDECMTANRIGVR